MQHYVFSSLHSVILPLISSCSGLTEVLSLIPQTTKQLKTLLFPVWSLFLVTKRLPLEGKKMDFIQHGSLFKDSSYLLSSFFMKNTIHRSQKFLIKEAKNFLKNWTICHKGMRFWKYNKTKIISITVLNETNKILITVLKSFHCSLQWPLNAMSTYYLHYLFTCS